MPLELQKIEQKLGISTEDFENKWELGAIEYREIIGILADKFSNKNCELTHSEYFIDEEGKINIVLCIDFFEDKSNLYGNFAAYIQENHKLLDNLRDEYILSVGFNYGQSKGFTITKDKIISISHDEFMDMPTEGNIPYRSLKGWQNVEKLLDNIYEELFELLSEKDSKSKK